MKGEIHPNRNGPESLVCVLLGKHCKLPTILRAANFLTTTFGLTPKDLSIQIVSLSAWEGDQTIRISAYTTVVPELLSRIGSFWQVYREM